MMSRVTLALVGGFLGAGKTTLLIDMARRHQEAGARAAIITNDQGSELIDTALVHASGLPNGEVTGGCLCCHFNEFVEAVGRTADESNPSLILAEAVGSCTDLVATVHSPMRRLYGERFRLAPMTVVVDVNRAIQLLGTGAKPFPAEVVYLFQQQIQEADIILLNKVDIVAAKELAEASSLLQALNPSARMINTSAVTGEGLAEWHECLERYDGNPGCLPLIQLDYDTYATAEAYLAWMNATVQVRSPLPFDLNALIGTLAEPLYTHFQATGAEAAHVKIMGAGVAGEASKCSLTVQNLGWDWTVRSTTPVTAAQILVNARVCTDPEALAASLRSVLQSVAQKMGVEHEITHLESFKPGRPVPVHRDLVAL